LSCYLDVIVSLGAVDDVRDHSAQNEVPRDVAERAEIVVDAPIIPQKPPPSVRPNAPDEIERLETADENGYDDRYAVIVRL